MLNVHGSVRTTGVQGTSDWTQVAVEFDNGDAEEITVHCLFGGYGGASGTAWFDDVALQPIGSSHSLPGALEMLATFRRATLAPAAQAQRRFAVADDVHARGAAVFARTCVACHGIDGKGLPKTFPPLDGSDWVTGEDRVAIDIVLHGLVGPIKVGDATFETVMAPLGNVINDTEIADVLTYVRQRWSNDAAPVSAEQVAARRAATRERPCSNHRTRLRRRVPPDLPKPSRRGDVRDLPTRREAARRGRQGLRREEALLRLRLSAARQGCRLRAHQHADPRPRAHDAASPRSRQARRLHGADGDVRR
jgi:mono/diheme cytochrome c family protein